MPPVQECSIPSAYLYQFRSYQPIYTEPTGSDPNGVCFKRRPKRVPTVSYGPLIGTDPGSLLQMQDLSVPVWLRISLYPYSCKRGLDVYTLPIK